jgi:CheY-like chemotaxis protein
VFGGEEDDGRNRQQRRSDALGEAGWSGRLGLPSWHGERLEEIGEEVGSGPSKCRCDEDHRHGDDQPGGVQEEGKAEEDRLEALGESGQIGIDHVDKPKTGLKWLAGTPDGYTQVVLARNGAFDGQGMAKIFIADDEADIRRLLAYVLADEGHEVGVAPDGREAIETMIMEPPEVLILDLMMPFMDGLAVLREMQDYQTLDSTKVLVLTAKGSEFDRHLAFDLGADCYLTKPFEADAVAQMVATMLELSKEELKVRREQERDTAHLLSQLESIFEEGSAVPGQINLDERSGE